MPFVYGIYNRLLQLDVEYVLIIVLLGRVWDGVTDPIVGYLCSRTKTKLGQFRPW